MIIITRESVRGSKNVIRHLVLSIATISASLLLSILSEVILCGAQTTQENKTLIFQWTMGVIRNTAGGGWEFETITDNTTLNTGDRVKFYIKPMTRCFIYLICRNSQGKLLFLFPDRLNETDIGDRISKVYLIPERAQWFQLDENTGEEKFILLSSLERLGQLETLIASYEAAANEQKIKIRSQIFAEIDSLEGKNSRLKTFAERPLSIIGQVRGAQGREVILNIDLAEYAVEITADKFYSRTFTIDHR